MRLKPFMALGMLAVILLQVSCAAPRQTSVAMGIQPDVLGVTAAPTKSALRPFVPTPTPPPTVTPLPSPPPLPTSAPTITPVATSTPISLITPVPTDMPTATETTAPAVPAASLAVPAADPATTLNGIPFSAIIPTSPELAANVRAIYARGQTLGRNPQAFSKLGDSLVLTDHYLTRFDNGQYNLGPFAALQPTLDSYTGSFARYGVATKVGLYADAATRPGRANETWCAPEEHMMACEFRLHNPSVMLIRIGTNDASAAGAFETALHRIVDYAVENGVIPVLGTKADRFEGDNRNNEMIRKVAAEYQIPLWDFDLVAGTLPDRGLSGDQAHLSVYKHNDYTDPVTLQMGYPVSDLTALVALDSVRAIVATP